MPIEEGLLADFSGGEIDILSSAEAAENEWLTLKGVVLDTNRRIRAQWVGRSWGVEAVEGS